MADELSHHCSTFIDTSLALPHRDACFGFNRSRGGHAGVATFSRASGPLRLVSGEEGMAGRLGPQSPRHGRDTNRHICLPEQQLASRWRGAHTGNAGDVLVVGASGAHEDVHACIHGSLQ